MLPSFPGGFIAHHAFLEGRKKGFRGVVFGLSLVDLQMLRRDGWQTCIGGGLDFGFFLLGFPALVGAIVVEMQRVERSPLGC